MTHLRLLPEPKSAAKTESPSEIGTLEKALTPVNPAMLIMGRVACGYTQSEFAPLVGATQGKLSRIEDWLASGVDPEFLEKCSEVTGYPVEFFTQEGNQKPLRESFFRRRATITGKVQKRAEALINIKRMEIEKLMSETEMEPPLTLPHWAPDEFHGGPREIARHLRATWGIPRGPIENLTQIVEDAGCVVVPFDFGTPKIDGVSTATRDNIPLIFMNPRAPTARYRLTLCHELAHLIMHRLPTPEMEDEAFDFAAEFMAPSQEIKDSFFPLDLAKLSRLKLKWGLSMQFFLRWAKQLGKIKESYYKFLSMSIARAGWRIAEPYDDETPPEKPTLISRIVAHYKEDYSADELCWKLRANRRTFPLEYAV